MILDKDPILNPVGFVDEADANFDLVSVLQGRVLEVFEALPTSLTQCSEFELCNKVDPGPTDYRLRQNFTDAVTVARTKGIKIRVTSVYDQVISRQVFFDFYLKNELKVAFITRPVIPHHAYYDAIFKEGLRKMFLYVRSHDLDPKTMATFAKIIEKAGDRVIGAVAQQVNMNQKQLVMHTKSPEAQDVSPEDPDLLEAKIREMQGKLSRARPAIEIEARNMIDKDED